MWIPTGQAVTRAGIAIAVLAMSSAGPARAADYFVDFATGDDQAPGSEVAPWRRAPGDPTAAGLARATKLHAGDTVHFRGGVVYRGTISVSAAATSDAPIRFVGDDWGDMPAVMHGGDPLPPATPCASQADCAGAENWESMVRVGVGAGRGWADWIFADHGPALSVAQYPTPADALAYDDVAGFQSIPMSGTAELEQGVIRFTGQPPSPGAELAIWGYPNLITFTDQLSVSGTAISFSAPDYQPYDDRANAYAVVNDPARISGPGQFAIVDGVAYLWPSSPGGLSIGSGRSGFTFAGSARNIVIEGFTFTGFSSRGETDLRAGIPVTVFNKGVDGLTVRRNSFRDLALMNRQGAINLLFVNSAEVSGNSFGRVLFGSGVRAGNGRGPVAIRCNRFSDTGRTAAYVQNIFTATIERNDFDRITGVHGNAISAYLDNRSVTIADNVITRSDRPMTLKGAGASAFFADAREPAYALSGNLIELPGVKSVGVQSWGGGLSGVTATDNGFTGPGVAYRWNSDDTDLAVGPPVAVGAADIVAKRAENAAACQS